MRKKWGTPQNFFLAFIDELEKQVIIKKIVEAKTVGPIKNKILIFKILHFLKMYKEKHL